MPLPSAETAECNFQLLKSPQLQKLLLRAKLSRSNQPEQGFCTEIEHGLGRSHTSMRMAVPIPEYTQELGGDVAHCNPSRRDTEPWSKLGSQTLGKGVSGSARCPSSTCRIDTD